MATGPVDVLGPLLACIVERLAAVELWLFGSRARGDGRPDSDWDLLAVIEDGASDAMSDPLLPWDVARAFDVSVTLLVTRKSELASIWGLPNSIGYDIAHDGIRLNVG